MWWATPSVRISLSHHDRKRTLASSFCFLISVILNNFWGKQNINRVAWWLSHVHENWKPQLSGLSWDKNSQNAWKDPNDSCLQIDPKIFLTRFWYVSFWLNQEIQMLGRGETPPNNSSDNFTKTKEKLDHSFLKIPACLPQSRVAVLIWNYTTIMLGAKSPFYKIRLCLHSLQY